MSALPLLPTRRTADRVAASSVDRFKRMKDKHFQPPFTWIFIGAKGSFTPLHCDVWMTDAWLAEFEGRKVFRLAHHRGGDLQRHAALMQGFSCRQVLAPG